MKCFLGLFCALIMTPALATPLAGHPIVVAVRHGDCAAAVKLVNANVAAPDQQFVGHGGSPTFRGYPSGSSFTGSEARPR